MAEFPLARLMQGRLPRTRHVAARDRFILAADYGVNDEFGGKVAAGGGDDRRADRQLAAQTNLVLEFLAAKNLQATQRCSRRVETSGGGTDDRIGGK